MSSNRLIDDSPAKALITFALPLILGNVFQQLYNMMDSIIVGNYVGADALARSARPRLSPCFL